MGVQQKPVSLAAERAVRLLRSRAEPVGSIELALEVLATRASDEQTATTVLEAAFAEDPRLVYDGGWACVAGSAPARRDTAPVPDTPRVLVLISRR